MNPLEDIVVRSQKADATKRLYARAVASFIEFAGQDPSNWTLLHVEQWRDDLLSQGVMTSSVKTYIASLRYVSKRYAQLYGGRDFAAHAELPTDIAGEPVSDSTAKGNDLSRGEVRRLLNACSGVRPIDLRDRALVLVMLNAAYRRSEICHLDFEHVVAKQVELIDGTTSLGAALSTIVKGRRWHTVEIAGAPWDALSAWMSWLDAQGVDDGPVFRSLRRLVDVYEPRRGITPDGLSRALARRAELAGIGNFHPHRLRHTFVTLAREAGWPDWRIRQITGHRSGGMTDHYTHNHVGAAFTL